MRFLILNYDFPAFLEWLYSRHPGLERRPYEEQMRVRAESLHFRADFYSENLCKLGYEAEEIYVNNPHMQRAWALEKGLGVKTPAPAPWAGKVGGWAKRKVARTPLRSLVRRIPRLSRSSATLPLWLHEVLAGQIEHHKPDVLLNTTVLRVRSDFLEGLKPPLRLIVGQPAPWLLHPNILRTSDSRCYDLVVGASPQALQWFRRRGVPAKPLRLGFEPRVLSSLNGRGGAPIAVSFVGSLYSMHRSRLALLETLCDRFDLGVWGPGDEYLSTRSQIRKAYRGQAWGLEMYQVLARSKVTLNHHGDVPGYATNMRLFEATGVGTLLVTDWKDNLSEVFEPGVEVAAYRDADECAELIEYYLNHEAEREAMAKAGQRRTLEDHTYLQRMEELVDIVKTLL